MTCKCKRINARLVKHAYNVLHSLKTFGVSLIAKTYNVTPCNKVFGVKYEPKKYGVCYCISYRPLGKNERILARGWRNDKGIWTPDGIFNDGKI